MANAARVIPDVPSFSVDDGFWYSIPDHLTANIEIGSMVRVPLGGRRVRGWVVERAERPADGLRDVLGLSGVHRVFDGGLLRSLQWAANHYIAPVASLLRRATPPNLPRAKGRRGRLGATSGSHPIVNVAERTALNQTSPIVCFVGRWREHEWLAALGPVIDSGKSVLIVAATVSEVGQIAERARTIFGEDVVSVDGSDAKSDTSGWIAAQHSPAIVVGTPKVAAWSIGDLGLAVVIEESRRAMKDRQRPTIHVRDLMATRSRVEGFNLAFLGPTPGVELLAAGADLVHVGNRAWALVEVVDRAEDRSGYIADRTMRAISGAVDAGQSVFVFTHRRGQAGSVRCARCRSARLCVGCQKLIGNVESCPHCGTDGASCQRCGGTEFELMGSVPQRLVAELNRRAGATIASTQAGDTAVLVGTERDLAGLKPIHLAVAADVDGILLSPGFRAEEEALRQLARLGGSVTGGSGSRLILQTIRPDSELVMTLKRGDPVPYLRRVLQSRAGDGMPPATQMIAVEVRGADSVTLELSDIGDAVVLGPLQVETGTRWLLTGDLRKARTALRRWAATARDAETRIRIDVDPIDV